MKRFLLTTIFLITTLNAQESIEDLIKNTEHPSIELNAIPSGIPIPSSPIIYTNYSPYQTNLTAYKSITGSNEYLGTIKSESSVNLSGGFNYTIPIEVPPGINEMEPEISLSYNSQSSSGIAGNGWDLNGISSINRIPKTQYYNGENKPIAFDHSDALAFDGQRLINVSPQNSVNAIYATEKYSNIKIVQNPTLFNPDPLNPTYMEGDFTVYYPNGSKANYDLKTDLEWLITSFEDIHGNIMEYSYIENKGRYYLSKIQYGHKKGGEPLNSIEFTYSFRESPSLSFIGGKSYINWYYLTKIKTFYKDQLIYRYTLDYQETPTSLRLHKINQYNRDNQAKAPLEFIYPNPYATSGMRRATSYSAINDGLAGQRKNIKSLSGDFDGDGQQDFLMYEKQLKNKLAFFKGYFDNGVYYKPAQIRSFNTSLENLEFNNFDGIFTRKFLSSSNTYLSQNDGITFVKSHKTTNTQTSFNFYTMALGVSSLYTQDIKKVSFNHPSNYSFEGDPSFYPGDYNNDGITDVIMIHRISYPINGRLTTGLKAFFIDLDRRKNSSGSIIIGEGITPNHPWIHDLGFLNTLIDDKPYVILTADFTGNGKSDFAIKKQGMITSFSFNENTHSLEKKMELFDDLIKMDHQTLVGDFNGDGKSDILIPEAVNSPKWRVYHATGKNFEKQTTSTIGPNYIPLAASSELQAGYHHTYTTLDYNRDGKSDLMYLKVPIFSTDIRSAYASLYYGHTSPYYPNPGSGIPAKDLAKSSLLKEQQDFNMGSGISIEDPIIGLDLDPTGRSNFQVGFYKKTGPSNTITSYQFLRDDTHYNRLQKVIDHSSGKNLDIVYNLDHLDTKSSVYQAQNNQIYPYVNINSIDRMALVESLEESYNRKIYKKQDFKYSGAVSHTQGLGYLGFSMMATSGWYDPTSSDTPIWTTTYYAPTQRGNIIDTYTTLGFSHRKPAESASYLLQKQSYIHNLVIENNKIVKNTPKTITSFDRLKDITTKESFTYDALLNPTKVTTDYGGRYGTTTVETFYNNKNASSGTYFRSRVDSTKTIDTHYGDTFTTSTHFTYNDKGLPKTIIKKGNDTNAYLKETPSYDAFGNVTHKILEAPNVSPREESYTYDPSGRFLTSSTDIKGLKTLKEYYEDTGLLKKETSPLGLITSYTYDNWMRPKTVTDYLKNTLTYYYEKITTDAIIEGDIKSGGFYIVEDASKGRDKKTYYDALGRAYKESTLSLKGKWISINTQYDPLDREIKKSEPYFDKPSLWTVNEYDKYNRIEKVTTPSGKIISNTYKGLEVFTQDGVQSHRVVVDPMGNTLEKEDDGGMIRYTYYANFQPKDTQYEDHVIEIEQNGWGKKIKLTDSAAGTYEYKYNGFGEITEEITPKGKTTYTYNDGGLLTNKTIEDPLLEHPFSTDYTYNENTFLLEKQVSNTSNLNTIEYSYDDYYRLEKTIEDNPEVTFTKEIIYDNYGKVLKSTTTSLLKNANLSSKALVTYQYESTSGILEKIVGDKGEILYQITDLNEREQLIGANYTNGIQIHNIWSDLGHLVSAKETSSSKMALDLEYNFDPIRGNLIDRKNYGIDSPIKEHFSYDVLDRLNRIKIEDKITSMLSYDKTGKITSNNQIGEYKYKENSSFKLDRIKLNTKGKERFKERTMQEATFASFKKPLEITEKNSGSVQFQYNGVLTRSKAIFEDQNDDITKIKFYSSDGSSEIVIPNKKKDIQFISYIGDPYRANISYISTFTSEGALKKEDYYFLHRDYLGSILAISDTSGEILEKRHYDPWGKLEQYKSGDPNLTKQAMLVDRGWTGHEHLDNVHLIHMNGRLYDADLKRMLSPDNYVQDPSNSQNFNRYQYGFNNPLKWNDPSGEFGVLAALGAIALGSLIGGASYAILSVGIAGNSFNWGDFFKSVAIGGASGLIASGIGEIATAMKEISAIGAKAFQITAHSLSQGITAVVEGQDFMQGFISGGISSITAGATLSVLGKFKKVSDQIRIAVTMITSSLAGGVSYSLAGGDFWRGFRNGAIISLLNEIAHDLTANTNEKTQKDPPWWERWQKWKDSVDWAKVADAGIGVLGGTAEIILGVAGEAFTGGLSTVLIIDGGYRVVMNGGRLIAYLTNNDMVGDVTPHNIGAMTGKIVDMANGTKFTEVGFYQTSGGVSNDIGSFIISGGNGSAMLGVMTTTKKWVQLSHGTSLISNYSTIYNYGTRKK